MGLSSELQMGRSSLEGLWKLPMGAEALRNLAIPRRRRRRPPPPHPAPPAPPLGQAAGASARGVSKRATQ
eukprot:5994846-Pyramimonas_sp.AAC.1